MPFCVLGECSNEWWEWEEVGVRVEAAGGMTPFSGGGGTSVAIGAMSDRLRLASDEESKRRHLSLKDEKTVSGAVSSTQVSQTR